MNNESIVLKIISYSRKIQTYCAGHTYESFVNNSMLVEATVFNLSQIGELANKVSSEYMDKHSQIPWRQLYGLRNRIVHDYEGVNLILVWDVVKEDIDDLIVRLESSLDN